MSALGPQFGETPSGLRYPTGTTHRAWISDPSVEPYQSERHRTSGAAENDYWSPKIRQDTSWRTGKPLVKPREFDNPNVSDPHTTSFVDYHRYEIGGGSVIRRHEDGSETVTRHEPRPAVYINFGATRMDQRGQGHARALVHGIADAHPDHDVDFGRVYHEHMWKIKDELERSGRKTYGSPRF